MKFQIFHRRTGEVQFECDLSAELGVASRRVRLGAAVKIAVEGGADLRGADLRDADLRDADLRDADLSDADLSGADLRDADLRGADLRDADLRDAVLPKAETPEEVARLDAVREIVVNKPERLSMSNWHSRGWDASHTPEEEHSCGSAHCIAGWLQALSPDEKVRQMQPLDAGKLLAPAASCVFFTSDSFALRYLKERLYAPTTEQPKE